MDFEFDEWARLAKEDPDAFERRRKAAIEAVIASAPMAEQQRLRGLQFRIDMERSRASTPLSACIRINRMMWDSFTELRTSIENLRDELGQQRQGRAAPRARKAARRAEIVQFPGAR